MSFVYSWQEIQEELDFRYSYIDEKIKNSEFQSEKDLSFSNKLQKLLLNKPKVNYG